MRCEASVDCSGGCESDARTAPGGAPADDVAKAAAASTAATTPKTTALAERKPTVLVEEVQVLGVDGERYVVAELQLDVRRERRDEVRARADDGALALARELLDLGVELGLDLPRVD